MKLKKSVSGIMALIMLLSSSGVVYGSNGEAVTTDLGEMQIQQNQGASIGAMAEESLVDCDLPGDELEEIGEDSTFEEQSAVVEDYVTSDAAISGSALSTFAASTNFFEYSTQDDNGVPYTITLNYKYGEKYYGMENVAQIHVVSKMPVCEIVVPEKITIEVDGIEREVTVVSVAESAFEGSKATKIVLPKTVFEIGARAFANCTNLTDISINTAYEANASGFVANGYYNKNYADSTKNVDYTYLPSSIGEYAFSGDTALKDVYINGIMKYGKYMFDGCTALNKPQFNIDGMYECYSNGSLKTNNLTITADTNLFENCTGMTDITFPKWFKSMGNKAFNGCYNLINVTLGVSISGTVNVDTFTGCVKLENIFVTGSDADPSYANDGDNCWNTTFRSVDGVLYRTDRDVVYDDDGNVKVTLEGNKRYAFVEKTLLVYPMGKTNEVFTAPVTLLSIEASAVANNIYLKYLYIDTLPKYSWTDGIKGETPQTVSIGANAFYNDTNIINVLIDNSSTIGNNAFKGDNKLKSVTINGTCKIGNNCFEDCAALAEFIYTGKGNEMGSYAFSGCAFKELKLDYWNKIGNNAFQNNTKLEKLEFQSDVYVVGDAAFLDCTALLTADISKMCYGGLMSGSLGINLFKGCISLKSAVWSDLVDGYSTGLFSGCTSLKTVTMPSDADNNISMISNYAFEECISLESIPYSRFLVTIDNNAFVNCTSLDKLVLSRSTVNIKNAAFNTMSPNFVIECVKGSYAEQFATARQVPVTYRDDDIDDYEFLMFSYVSVTKEVYDQTDSSFKYVTQDGNNYKYYRLELNGYRGGFDRLIINSTTPIYISKNWIDNPFGVSTATKNNNNMKTFLKGIKLYNVYEIGEYAFGNIPGLMTVVFDDELYSIAKSAFNNCYVLSNSIDWAVTNSKRGWTGELAQPADTDVVTIKCLDENTFTLAESAFQNCKAIKHIALPDNIASINANTFNGCVGLQDITLPAKCTMIYKNAFTGCTSLKDINFNIMIERICEQAFSNCTALETVVFQQNVFLEKDIFKGCKMISKIITPHTLNMVYERDPFPDTKTCLAVCAAESQGYEYATAKGFEIELAQFLDGLYTVTLTFVTIPEGLTVTAIKTSAPDTEVVLKDGDYLVAGDQYKVSATQEEDKIAVVTVNGNSVDEDVFYTLDAGYTKLVFDVTYVDAMVAGDADCDGFVTAADAAMVMQHALSSSAITFSESVKTAVDVDGDGIITAADAAEILQKSLNQDYVFSKKTA